MIPANRLSPGNLDGLRTPVRNLGRHLERYPPRPQAADRQAHGDAAALVHAARRARDLRLKTHSIGPLYMWTTVKTPLIMIFYHISLFKIS